MCVNYMNSYTLLATKIILLNDLCGRENDLEIVLPTDADDVDIDSSSIGNVRFVCFMS